MTDHPAADAQFADVPMSAGQFNDHAADPGAEPSQVWLVSYRCARAHHTWLVSGPDTLIPSRWPCRCGLPTRRDPTRQPEPVIVTPHKTHFDHLRERRSDAEGQVLVAEALDRLRATRRTRPASLVATPHPAPRHPGPDRGPAVG